MRSVTTTCAAVQSIQLADPDFAGQMSHREWQAGRSGGAALTGEGARLTALMGFQKLSSMSGAIATVRST